jgi:hypothetical protein
MVNLPGLQTTNGATIPVVARATGLLLALALAGCGGGGVDGPVALPAALSPSPTVPAPPVCTPPPEGASPPIALVAGGMITGRADPSFILVAPSASTRLLFYGPDLRTESRVTGYVWGGAFAGCQSADATSYNGTDYPSETRTYLLTLPQATAPEVSGSIRNTGGTAQFTGGRIPGSTYVFDAAPRVADAVGTWSLNPLKGDPFRIQIDADGALAGDVRRAQLFPAGGGNPDDNCKLSGMVTVASQAGLNLLKLTVSTPCWDYPNFPYEGFALVMPLESGGTQLLIWAWTNNGVDATVLFGIGRR